MTHTIVAIADQVVFALNASVLSQPLTAERRFRVEFGLDELETLRVSVVPKAVNQRAITRSKEMFDYEIDIGIQQKIPSEDNVDIEPLLALAEEILAFLRFQKLLALPDVTWLKAEHTPIYSAEHLGELRVFTSVLTVTYRRTA
ncbi:MAG: hypothetical protein AB7F75_01265 [Planctomycetota bacterium]